MLGSPAVYAVQVLAVGTGVALARQRHEHAPVAALLAFGLAIDIGLELPVKLFTIRLILGAAYPWAVVACVREVLGPRWPRSQPRRVLAGFLVYVAVLVAMGHRGRALAVDYSLCQAGIAGVLAWRVGRWRLRRHAGHHATATEASAVIVAATEIANVVAYLDLPRWVGARAVYALCYVALTAVQTATLARTRRPPCRPLTPSTQPGQRS